jgi:hypothetical protein
VCAGRPISRSGCASRMSRGVLPDYFCRELLMDRRREVSLLVQSHLKRDPAARSDRLDPQLLSVHRAGCGLGIPKQTALGRE